MAIEEALTSLLSGVAGGRRYWGWREGLSAADGAYLSLYRISAPRDYAMSGPTGYVMSRFQIDVFADQFSEARDATAAAIAALSGHRGTTAGTRIMGIFVDDERDFSSERTGGVSDAGGVTPLYRRSIDIIVHHDE